MSFLEEYLNKFSEIIPVKTGGIPAATTCDIFKKSMQRFSYSNPLNNPRGTPGRILKEPNVFPVEILKEILLRISGQMPCGIPKAIAVGIPVDYLGGIYGKIS